jgi:hypothetical protein
MQRVRVLPGHRIDYEGQRHQGGDVIALPPGEASVHIMIGHAEAVNGEVEVMADPPRQKRKYQRRDMQATA